MIELLWVAVCGAVLGAEGAALWRDRQARRAARVVHLRVSGCVLVDCELETLVTYNEDDGMSELRDYCIMPKSTWLAHYAPERHGG